jgi:hypothetical protein
MEGGRGAGGEGEEDKTLSLSDFADFEGFVDLNSPSLAVPPLRPL